MRLTAGLIAVVAMTTIVAGQAPGAVAASSPVKNGNLTFNNYSYAPGNEGPGIFAQAPRSTSPAAAWLYPTAVQLYSPKYSPDGTEIAFYLVDANQDRWLMIRSAGAGIVDGAIPLQIDVTLDGIDWSPDAIHFVLADLHSLYILDSVTGRTTTIFTTPGQLHTPAWSPDGTQIAFAQGDRIKLINPDGTGLRTFTSTPRGFSSLPDWSRDSRTIAFVTSRFGDDELVTMARSGRGRLTRVSHLAGQPPARFFFTDIAWSPDGKKIAALETEDIGDQDWNRIRAYASDGSHKYWLTDRLDPDGQVATVDWARVPL
jgi:Tol biopolymer transport system component